MRFPTKTELAKIEKDGKLHFVSKKVYRPLDIEKIEYQEKKQFYRLDR